MRNDYSKRLLLVLRTALALCAMTTALTLCAMMMSDRAVQCWCPHHTIYFFSFLSDVRSSCVYQKDCLACNKQIVTLSIWIVTLSIWMVTLSIWNRTMIMSHRAVQWWCPRHPIGSIGWWGHHVLMWWTWRHDPTGSIGWCGHEDIELCNNDDMDMSSRWWHGHVLTMRTWGHVLTMRTWGHVHDPIGSIGWCGHQHCTAL